MPDDTPTRLGLLQAVLEGYESLGPLLARARTLRREMEERVRAVPWQTIRPATLVYVQDKYVDMLVAIQRFWGARGEQLLRELDLYPNRPEAVGDLIRHLYVCAILLTRQPDPMPWLQLVHATAAAGPAAENELVRRLRQVHGGEVPRLTAATLALRVLVPDPRDLQDDPKARMWLRRVLPGLRAAPLEGERDSALEGLAAKMRESLRARKGVWKLLHDRAVDEEGPPRRRPGEPIGARPSRRETDEVLAHALSAWTLIRTLETWGESVDGLIVKALKQQLGYAPKHLADRYLDYRRDRVRPWRERATLFGLDPQPDRVDDDNTIKFEVSEDVASAAMREVRRRDDDGERQLQSESLDEFLATHPEYRADARLWLTAKRVVGLARERRVDPTTIRRRRRRFERAYRDHRAGVDGCPGGGERIASSDPPPSPAS